MEAQRYPGDFDGIVAGAPMYNWTVEAGARNTRLNAAMYPDPDDLLLATITPDAQTLIGNAVLEQCDALDGLEDRILSNPAQCEFDVRVIGLRRHRGGCVPVRAGGGGGEDNLR